MDKGDTRGSTIEHGRFLLKLLGNAGYIFGKVVLPLRMAKRKLSPHVVGVLTVPAS